MARESFEIYAYQDGRWSVHGSYEGNQREEAQAAAVELEKQSRVPVRLVRETFHPETNTSEEVVAWQSAKAKEMPDADNMFGTKAPAKKDKPKRKPPPPPPPPRAKAPEPAPTPAPESAPAPIAKAEAAPKPKKRKKKKKSRSFLTKIAIVVAMSLAMAAGAALATMLAIAGLQELRIIKPADRSVVVAGVFVLSYAASALYQLVVQFELRSGWKSGARAKKASPADMIQKMTAAAPASADMSEINMDSPAAAAEVAIEDLRASIEQQEAEVEGDRLGESEEFTSEVQTAADLPTEETQAPPPVPDSQPAQGASQAPEPPKVEAPPPKPVEKPPERPPAEADAQKHFMVFVGDAVKIVNGGQAQLNAMSRFGLNLYLAGACSSLGQTRKLGRVPQLTILRDGLQSAGTSRERAESFCAELPSYGKNPRYTSMLQAGGNAMTRHMQGQIPAATDLADLLGEWGRPEKRTTVPTEITFLFTDLVGSTAMTSQLGNQGAQKVVRAHNSAVREAIKAFGGREVKHTGDGIMATFPTPVAGVQASIRMQKELVQVANSNPALNFSVRMGLNVGEAVEEDNDYFGAAVQMTARICAASTERNIWVSKAIVDACKGQRIGFIPRGAFQMKGIQQARPLYEVAYTEAHKNELANI